jgi:hypothetical protein
MPAPPQYHPTWQGGISSYNPSLREKMVYALQGGLGLSDDREGVRKARMLANALEMTPVGLATGLEDVQQAAGRGDYIGAGINLAMAGLPGPPIKKGIRAFHGSPHDFDKFSLDKIGTGEGAQAYGHGLYFAENEGVAKQYREQLSRNQDGWPNTAKRVIKDATGVEIDDDAANAFLQATAHNDDPAMAAKKAGWASLALRDLDLVKLAEAATALKNVKPGHTYEVEINADPEQFLDWDKPLSEQTNPNLQSLLGENNPDRHAEASVAIRQGVFGASDEATSKKLKEAGIPGIKYLDQGSRPPTQSQLDHAKSLLAGAEMNGDPAWIAKQRANVEQLEKRMTQPGTRNYVVFDDKLLDIKRKYGISGLFAAMGLAGAAGYSDDAQAQTPQMQGGW